MSSNLQNLSQPERDLLYALGKMCLQYTDVSDELGEPAIRHFDMVAGELALHELEKYGLVSGVGKNGGMLLTEAGKKFLDI